MGEISRSALCLCSLKRCHSNHWTYRAGVYDGYNMDSSTTGFARWIPSTPTPPPQPCAKFVFSPSGRGNAPSLAFRLLLLLGATKEKRCLIVLLNLLHGRMCHSLPKSGQIHSCKNPRHSIVLQVSCQVASIINSKHYWVTLRQRSNMLPQGSSTQELNGLDDDVRS